MGILNKIQKIMCPDVWDPNRKLWPHLKTQILTKLYTVVPKEQVTELYLVGSTTGWQWEENSDIDLNVTIPKELAEDPKYVNARKRINGFVALGTRHPVNFFWVPQQEKPQFWGDSYFGVYDVLNDIWVADPGDWSLIQDPDQEYMLHFASAKMILRDFENRVERWLSNLRNLHKLENAKPTWINGYYLNKTLNHVRYETMDLIEFCHELDRNRKFIYSWGYGIPRKSYQNIVFKIIEDSKYVDYFEFFKELKGTDLVSRMQEIINEQNSADTGSGIR